MIQLISVGRFDSGWKYAISLRLRKESDGVTENIIMKQLFTAAATCPNPVRERVIEVLTQGAE
jgi:hypothetical protein